MSRTGENPKRRRGKGRHMFSERAKHRSERSIYSAREAWKQEEHRNKRSIETSKQEEHFSSEGSKHVKSRAFYV